jgi:hypothetical protein
LQDDFKTTFQFGVLEPLQEEIETLVLMYKKRFFLFSKTEMSSDSNMCHVLSIKNLISIYSVTLGLFMRSMKIQFADSNSVLFITRSKDVTVQLVNLITDAFQNSSFADLTPSFVNQDREFLEYIQVRFFNLKAT